MNEKKTLRIINSKLKFNAFQMIHLLLTLLILIPADTTESEILLHQLFDDYHEYTLQINPLASTERDEGPENAAAILPETGLDAVNRRYHDTIQFLARTEAIDRDELSEENRLNYDIFRLQLENSKLAYEVNDHLLPLNGWWDYHATFADLGNRVPLNNSKDYENYLSRLVAFPQYNSGYIERMRKGVETGFVRPKIVFEDYLASIEAHIVETAEESRLFAPFLDFPAAVPESDRDRLKTEAKEIIMQTVVPEFDRLVRFLGEEYIPSAAEKEGICFVAGGVEYCQYLVEMHTTMQILPEEVHLVGLDEVARIRDEMMEIVQERGFENDFDGFIEYLRTDPRFYAESAEELMKETAYVLKKMDGKLPELFKTLPRLPYGIMEVPDYLAPRTATAYYSRGAADGTRAGFYAVNTYDLTSRPLFEVVALSLHEAVPGHHLQIALQQELEGLPRFRTAGGFTAYTEGWALYSERLGLEVGMYDDPYSNFGRLSYEMWRALRLVVDTGIHAKGWSREEAVEFMAANSALSLHNIRSEVNRYIFWPGQALAYKMGEIKIRELREMAEIALGDYFDLREFHDVILLSGSVPLSVLEDNIKMYVDQVLIEKTL